MRTKKLTCTSSNRSSRCRDQGSCFPGVSIGQGEENGQNGGNEYDQNGEHGLALARFVWLPHPVMPYTARRLRLVAITAM